MQKITHGLRLVNATATPSFVYVYLIFLTVSELLCCVWVFCR